MRTENEMHDLVVAKVAAHRRRRTLLASAGGGVAAVLLLVAVAAGASSSGPDEDVNVDGGDPTTTTEAPTTTTEAPGEPTTTTEPPLPPASAVPATTAPPSTTTEPSATTTEPPTTTTTTTTAPVGVEETTLTGRDGDLEVVFTVTTDVARPGLILVRVRAVDPTGSDIHADGRRFGVFAGVGLLTAQPGDVSVSEVGDAPGDCGSHGALHQVGEATLDEVIELPASSGHHRISLGASTLFCHDQQDVVSLEHELDVP